MPTLASLDFVIRNGQIVSATRSLDDMTAAAGRAEGGAVRLGTAGVSTERAVSRIAFGLDRMAISAGTGAMGLRSIEMGLMALAPGLGWFLVAGAAAYEITNLIAKGSADATKEVGALDDAHVKAAEHIRGLVTVQEDGATRLKALRDHYAELKREITALSAPAPLEQIFGLKPSILGRSPFLGGGGQTEDQKAQAAAVTALQTALVNLGAAITAAGKAEVENFREGVIKANEAIVEQIAKLHMSAGEWAAYQVAVKEAHDGLRDHGEQMLAKGMADTQAFLKLMDAAQASISTNITQYFQAQADGAIAARKAITDQTDALTLQIEEFGMSAGEQAAYTVAIHGGTIEQQLYAKALADTLQGLKDLHKEETAGEKIANEMLKEVQRDFASFFDEILTKGVASFKSLFDSVWKMFAQLVSQMAAADMMGAITGKGAGGAGLGQLGGLAGGIDAGMLGAGLGYTTGSPIVGAFGGAASGALIGTYVAPGLGTVLGGVIGGLAGLIGGFLGASDAADKAAEQLRQLAAAAQANVTAFVKTVYGGALPGPSFNFPGGNPLGGLLPGFGNWPGFNPAGVQPASDVTRGEYGWQPPLSAALDQLHARADALRNQAGITADALKALNNAEAVREAQLIAEDALTQTQAQEDYRVRLLYAQGKTAEADALALAEKQQREYLAAVKGGATEQTLAALATAQAAETLAVKIAPLTTLITTLAAFRSSLDLSSASPLSPIAQYALAQSHYQAAVQAAFGGDQTAAAGIPAVAQAWLTASRAVNASGIAYAQDYAQVQQDTDQIRALFQGQKDVYQKSLDALGTISDYTKLTTGVLTKELPAQTAVQLSGFKALSDRLDLLAAKLDENTAATNRGFDGLTVTAPRQLM